MSARGYHVQVVTLNSEQRRANQLTSIEGIPVQYLSWAGAGHLQVPLNPGALADVIRQAEIIHCYGLYNLLSPIAAFLSQQQNKPFLIEPMGMAVVRTGHRSLKRLYHRAFTAYLLRHATCVIAGSPVEAQELSPIVKGDRLVLRRLGVDVTYFQSLPSDAAFRNNLGIAPDEKVVLYVGRISPIKNLEMLVRAFSQANLQRTRLVLVGPMLEPKYTAQLRSLIDKCDLANRVLLVGPLYDRDKLAALAAADLFVLPSLAESYGLVAAEAVAAGIPVLLTETCGIAHQIHRRAGLAVPVDEQALVIGLQTLVKDSAQRAILTQHQDEVIQQLSWSEPLDKTEHIYKTILQPRPTATNGASVPTATSS